MLSSRVSGEVVRLLGHSLRNATSSGELGAGWAGGRTQRKLWPRSSWKVRDRLTAGCPLPGRLPGKSVTASQLAPEEENKPLGDALRIRSQATP